MGIIDKKIADFRCQCYDVEISGKINVLYG